MRIYSVAEYRAELNDLLGQVTVVIEAEITSLNVSQNRFVWFTLSDDDCSIDCFMLQFEMKQPLEEGMRVRVTGSPNMFKKGKVVFRPRKVELVGDGDLQRAFELLKAQLEKEGLFDERRKRAIPKIPTRIGIVTSRDAAAYTDVLRVLQNRWSGLHVVLAHVQVQGDAAPTSITQGLERMYAFAKTTELDCIIVTRGGGSMEDLQAFNTESVVRAVYASPVPVISAVGHERDTTLIDFVADVRAATPSNAAEMVVPHRNDVLQSVEYVLRSIAAQAQRKLMLHQQQVEQHVQKLLGHAQQPLQEFALLEQRLEFARQALRRRIAHHIEQATQREKYFHELHPHRLLERGYAIVRDENGDIILTSSQAKKHDQLHIQFSDDEVEVEIKKRR